MEVSTKHHSPSKPIDCARALSVAARTVCDPNPRAAVCAHMRRRGPPAGPSTERAWCTTHEPARAL